ncbi:hypothetical protein A2U01_0025085, partial [Trifolium medium]|nr:hypothetical protein [Trifolium medium]
MSVLETGQHREGNQDVVENGVSFLVVRMARDELLTCLILTRPTMGLLASHCVANLVHPKLPAVMLLPKVQSWFFIRSNSAQLRKRSPGSLEFDWE